MTLALAAAVSARPARSAAALGAHSRPASSAAALAVRLLRLAELRFESADEMTAEVELLPSTRELRRGANAPAAGAIKRADLIVARTRRGDRALIAQLTALIAARPRGLGAQLRRARALLREVVAALGSDETRLSADSRVRRHAPPRVRTASASRAAAPAPLAVVSLGDSYISGEGGRWAGNAASSSDDADALGANAYAPVGASAEEIDGCHRSRSAEIDIGQGVVSKNFACSGAQTATMTTGGLLGMQFKPGLDFAQGSEGQGQALQLEEYAKTHDVRMVVVSIGGNDFGFGDVVQACVTAFVFSGSRCQDDPKVTARLLQRVQNENRAAIVIALRNIERAMSDVGYQPSAWRLVVQTYPAPLPPSGQIRYPNSGRQSTGGCGIYNADIDWARATFLPAVNNAVTGAVALLNRRSGVLANAILLQTGPLFVTHELCSTSTQLIADWKAKGAVQQAEWFTQVRTISTVEPGSPYQIQESLHPDYWGQYALRDCLRELWNGGAITGVQAGSIATCRDESRTPGSDGLNALGEPLTGVAITAP